MYILYGYEFGRIPWSNVVDQNTTPKEGVLAKFPNPESAARFREKLHERMWAANTPNPAKFGGKIIKKA